MGARAGMMLSNEFPVNYFSVSEVEQEFDDFQEMFQEGALPGDNSYWRFNKARRTLRPSSPPPPRCAPAGAPAATLEDMRLWRTGSSIFLGVRQSSRRKSMQQRVSPSQTSLQILLQESENRRGLV